MPDNDDISDLGPLPQADRNSELQRSSIKALNALLRGQDALLFRDERVEDYGVDGALELIIQGGATNFRGQVQLKATESVGPNRDGSISLSVRTANLNYLLNGTSPIYLLFDADQERFWYVWAHDENRRLTAINPEWRTQEEITLRFTERLVPDAFPQIVGRVRGEGQMHRRVHDALARATASEQVVISINPESLAIQDPGQAQHILLASGPALVAAGFPKEALNMLALVDFAIRGLPRLQLTAGYAEYMLGNHFNALGHIRQALARAQELSERDRTFLASLKDTCEFHVGIIDAPTYRRLAADRANSLRGLESLDARLEDFRFGLLMERDREARSLLMEGVREVTTAIRAHPDASDAIKLSAKLALLYLEGTEATIGVMHQLGLFRMRAATGMIPTAAMHEQYQEASRRLAEWDTTSHAELNAAYKLRHPILIGEALTAVIGVRIFQLVNRKMEALFQGKVIDIPKNTIDALFDLIETALSIYRLNEIVESTLRVKMLKAELLEIIGDVGGAKELATEVYPVAEAMSFLSIAIQAKDVLDNKTTLMEFDREWNEFREADQDVTFASLADDQLRRFARETLESQGLPVARLQVMEQYAQSVRDVARERVRWCRHLGMLDDLRQTLNPVTAFTVPPNRKCICEKFGFETVIVTSDARALLDTFKTQYCAKCEHRSPKQQ